MGAGPAGSGSTPEAGAAASAPTPYNPAGWSPSTDTGAGEKSGSTSQPISGGEIYRPGELSDTPIDTSSLTKEPEQPTWPPKVDEDDSNKSE